MIAARTAYPSAAFGGLCQSAGRGRFQRNADPAGLRDPPLVFNCPGPIKPVRSRGLVSAPAMERGAWPSEKILSPRIEADHEFKRIIFHQSEEFPDLIKSSHVFLHNIRKLPKHVSAMKKF